MRSSFIIALLFLLIGAAIAHPSNPIRSKRDTELVEDEFSGDNSGDGSGDASGEGSGSGDGSGEGSGEESPIVPVDELTLHQLETLNTYAQQVQQESQKLIHQANMVITEMTALAANAQSLGALSNIVLANSQIVLDNARFSLNETDTVSTTTASSSAPGVCTQSAVCYGESGCGSGKCVGALAGTCNCNSCVYGWPCQEDSACGGFQGACNSLTATCDCFGAYAKNNMTLTEALTSFCNVETCNGAENNVEKCFGLPCNYGFCVC